MKKISVLLLMVSIAYFTANAQSSINSTPEPNKVSQTTPNEVVPAVNLTVPAAGNSESGQNSQGSHKSCCSSTGNQANHKSCCSGDQKHKGQSCHKDKGKKKEDK